MNVRRFVPLIVLIGILAGGYFVDRYRAAHRSQLSGIFEAQPARLAPKIAGRVKQILVREGQKVTKGQTLVILDAPDVAASSAAAQDLADQAEWRAKEVVSGNRAEDIRRQEAVVAELSANLTKAINGPLPEELTIARKRVSEARDRYQIAIRGARPEEIAQAKAAEREARARLDAAHRGLTKEEKSQLQARVDAARADANFAQAEANRQEQLYKEGAVSLARYQQVRAQADAAQAKLRDAEQALSRALQGTPSEELRQAQAAYDRAKAALDLVLAGSRPEDVSSAKSELDIAQQNLALLERGTRQEDVHAAQARLAQAQAALAEMKNGSRKEEIGQAQAAAGAAKNQAKSTQSLSNEQTIVAQSDGVIERIMVADGDLVGAGTPIVQIADPNDIWIRVYVPETILAKIKIDDEATLIVDGIDDSITGTVESINTQGEFTPANLQTPEERGKQVFGVRIRLKTPDPRVKAGMAASVKRLGQWP